MQLKIYFGYIDESQDFESQILEMRETMTSIRDTFTEEIRTTFKLGEKKESKWKSVLSKVTSSHIIT